MTCAEGGFVAGHAFAARIGGVGGRLGTDPTFSRMRCPTWVRIQIDGRYPAQSAMR
jgi:hypothetical protein